MRWILAVLVVVVALGATARAGTMGLIVTGDAGIQARLTKSATRYAEQHGYTLTPALDPTGVTTLLDCLAIDDDGCARSVVEVRAKSEIVLAVRAEISQGQPREIRLVAYWIAKGHSPVAMRRVCEKCSDEALDSMFDAMLGDLVRSSATGRLVLKSHPPGLLTILDNQPIGSTPLERDVPVGQHALQLVQNGKQVAQRYFAIMADERAELDIRVEAHHGPSRTLPALVIGAGVAVVIGGGVLYATSESPTGLHPTYRDTKPAGIGVAVGGAALVGVGVFLLLRGGGETGPTVNVAAGGASAGWIGRF